MEEVDDYLVVESSDDVSVFYVDILILFVVFGVIIVLGFSIGYGRNNCYCCGCSM